MGASSRRQLRAALGFMLRPFLFAVALTILARLLFSSKAPPPKSSHSAHAAREGAISKALVVASTSKDDTSWLSQVPPDWNISNYVVDAPTSPQLSVPANRGNEAMAYLTYIVDHYDSLPDVVFFHHGHAQAWHQSLDSQTEVARLRPSYVLKAGYASTRCLPGCENVVSLADRPGDFSMFRVLPRSVHLTTLLDAFLDPGEGGATAPLVRLPAKLAAPCCAQFAVSRDAVRRRSRDWWADLRGWLLNTPLESINSGRLMEHTWHMWFGMEPQLCPSYEACRCHVFGIGDCDQYFEQGKSM